MTEKSNAKVFKFDSSRRRRRNTWNAKHQTKALQGSYEDRLAAQRQALLAASRASPSIANGLKNYRQSLGLSQTAFAKKFGITRRTLFNYENGIRAVSGELLEHIVARGDVELSDIFGLPPEPATKTLRLDDARLALDLYAACKVEYPSAPDEDVRAYVVSETANWPVSLKRTDLAIKRVARRAMNQLSHEHMLKDEYMPSEANLLSDPPTS